MPKLNWTLVVEQDTSEALAWLNRLIFRVTLTGAITLVVLTAAAYWISNRLGQPLRVLARVAQQVSAGNTGERVGPLAGAEAEEVRRAFNKMLDELHEKQKELIRTATLAGIGELSSSIVHEMRNPLSSIKMNLQALKHEVDDDAANRELAAIADAQVRRLEHMLDDLLQYGRPLEVRPEPARFEELAKAVIAVVGEQARAKQVRIETKDRLLKSPLRVDREQMCRALTNLIANAIQATPPGSTVSVVAHKESLYADTAIIDVEDSGPGLSEEAIDRVFKPFFTTKQNGTGLGLANVRKIVELHGGKVSARNRAEGGACFSIRLPLVKEGDREDSGD
jgi:signal transduction histidine kinase